MDGAIMTLDYSAYREELRSELRKQTDSFVRTGYLLRLAMDTDILEGSGYANVNEFAKGEFNLDPSTVSRYININLRFSEGGYSERIAEAYRGIGYAKLSLMLLLPDSINEEITPAYSKAEVQAIKEEYEAERRVTDLEVLMEGRDPDQEGMDNNLQKALHQMFHDEKDLFVKVWGIPEGLEGKNLHSELCDILAPQGESCHSVRVQGVGRLMLFVKGAGKDLVLENIRSGEKETYGWEALETAVRGMKAAASGRGIPSGDAGACWECIYGEKFGEKKEIAPVQPEKKKTEPRKQSRVTKAAGKKPAGKQTPAAVPEPEEQPEEQIPGQMSIEKDMPELLPETPEEIPEIREIPEPPETPETPINTECGEDPTSYAGENGGIWDAGETPEPPEIPVNTECGEDLTSHVMRNIGIWDRAEETVGRLRLAFKRYTPTSDSSVQELEAWLGEMYRDAAALAADLERLMIPGATQTGGGEEE